MSRVICDVCGTTYPETAAQCPICGSAKNSADQTAAGTGENEAPSSSYAYVRGGRFSKKNVRRRSSRSSAPAAPQRRSSTGDPAAPQRSSTAPSAPPQRRSSAPTTAQRRSNTRDVQEREEGNNTGLVIVAVLLVVAILAMLIYIFVHFANRNNNNNPSVPDNTGSTPSTQQTDPKPSTGITQIPCTGLKLSNDILELAVGESWTLQAQLTPVDTTDAVTYTTGNPDVARVSETGVITVVGEGETVITVTCGDQTALCTVKTLVAGPTPGVFEFEFNTYFVDPVTGNGDCTLTAQGATWRAYKSDLTVPVEDIIWTSDDPSIASISNGIVTAVAPGSTKIHAQYNGVTYTCVIRCSFTASAVTPTCTLSHTDVTIAVGESFRLRLRNAEGVEVEVTWTADGDGVSIEVNKITGVTPGTYKLTTTYEGATYSCTVRVKTP